MSVERRGVIKAMVAAGVVAGASTEGMSVRAATPSDATLIHHVFFWLKNPGSTEDRANLIAGLQTLREIPVIRSLHIGVPASTEQRDVVDSSFDVSELMAFDSVADQKTYQDHPLHKAFVARCEPLWRKVVVYDVMAV